MGAQSEHIPHLYATFSLRDHSRLHAYAVAARMPRYSLSPLGAFESHQNRATTGYHHSISLCSQVWSREVLMASPIRLTSSTSLLDLPGDPLLFILSSMQAATVACVLQTCSRLHLLAADNSLWDGL